MNITETEVLITGVVIANSVGVDKVITTVGALTMAAGTILQTAADGEVAVYTELAYSDEALFVLTEEVVIDQAGTFAIRPMKSGTVNSLKLVVDGVLGASQTDIERLRSWAILSQEVRDCSADPIQAP